jgi:preprotein translocase subunit SecG
MEADMATDYGSMSSGSRGPMEQESAANLLSRLVGDVTALFRNELALAKAELSKAATNVKVGVAGIATGAAVLLAGALALVAAAILGLAEVMDPWLAALIVGVALGVIGFVMIQSAKKKLEPSALTMERTQQSLRQDAEVVARRT